MEETRRQALFSRHCATIRAAMSDFSALSSASQRVLEDPEVKADSTLRSMLRTFVAQRQAELHNQKIGTAFDAPKGPAAAAPGAGQARRTTFADPELYRQSAQWVRGQFTNLRLHFEDRLAHYDEAAARRDLEEMRALHEHNPGMLDAPVIERCAQQLVRLHEKLKDFRTQIEELKTEALYAARHNEPDRALWIARRLSAIHDMLPEVLPPDKFEALHGQILAVVKSEEHQEALHELVAFERAVADQIKGLAGRIHRFHAVSAREPVDSPVYQEAQREYEECVRHVLERDEDWLASLMLKLDSLLEDLEEDRSQAEQQVERFIENVRSALIKVRREIVAIRAEHKARQSGNPPKPAE